MKILQVMAGAKRGGAETAFVDMCLALHEAGETIEVVTRANDIRVPIMEKAGIKVHTLSFGGVADVFTRWKMAKIIKDFEPDIVQTWMARAAWKTPQWSESLKIPRYVTVSRLGGYYNLKYFKSADFFTTITPDIRRYLIEKGVPEKNVRHINNFADVEQAETPMKRSDYGVPDDAPLLLGLGRLHPSKAFDVLIKAVKELPGIYLWIAGEGPSRKDLETLIADLNVADRVTLLGWQPNRGALFDAINICVFSSRYEPFGTVFVQSWAMRTPLITTNSDGPSQYVRDGIDGLVVPVDNIEAMKAAIGRLAGDKALQNQLVEAGYKRYVSEFTKENTVRTYLELYHSLKNAPPANL